MTDTVVLSLPHSSEDADRIAQYLNADRKEYSRENFREVFHTYRKIVAIMAAGIVVRAMAPEIRNKWEDPAVVVISPNLRYAIPLLGGHHGANALAKELAGAGLIPVITTATEAMGKESVEAIADRTSTEILNRDSTRAVNGAILEGDVQVYPVPGPGVVIAGPRVSVLLRRGEFIVGIGCRKGIRKDEVITALGKAFTDASIDRERIFAYVTTEKKKGERGLEEAIADLSGTLVYLDDRIINEQKTISVSRAGDIGLVGVAEPCALALSRHKNLVLFKTVYGGVTVAIAR
ncbi:MAG: cobalt-precorrin 5A hydrolase [Methanomicrobiales archaeon]|nr:cobalt-precorrin 5A hydrolase [Methanomicrobiales archaeon]